MDESLSSAVFEMKVGILENVLAFLPFEQQAGKLRLVSRNFKAASEFLLRDKLFNKVICYHKYSHSTAEFRRGWSNNCCTSREKCIEEALQMVACRCDTQCAFDQDADMAGCVEKASQKGYNKVKSWNDDQCRLLLRSNGWFSIRNSLPTCPDGQDYLRPYERGVKIRYQECNMSSDDICDEIVKEIHRVVKRGPMSRSVRFLYGIQQDISWARFLRSMFISFTQPKTDLMQSPEARGPSISMARSYIEDPGEGDYGECYTRMRMFFRFYTTANEPVEVRLQCKNYASHL